MTEDKHNYRERTAQIVIEVAQEAASETRIPRVEEALHLSNAVIELRKKRAVLVIEIHSQNGDVTERYEAVADINYQHYDGQAAESEPTVFVVFKYSVYHRTSFVFNFHLITCLISLSF